MAEIPMSGQGMTPEEPRTLGPLINLFGAVASLALVAGAGVWGYKLLVRDVSGVPVVRAVEGPMRVQPDDPGGRQAEHQGLAVNAVAADGAAAAPADRLVLAPEPIDLTAEDERLVAASVPQVEPATTREAPAPQDTSDIVAPPPLSADKIDAISELANQIAAETSPLASDPNDEVEPVKTSLATPETTTTPEPAATEPEAEPVVFTNGVSHSLRPVLRPEGLGNTDTRLASAAPADTTAAPKAIDADAIPAGTHLVQLGAFASEDIAASEWDKLTVRFDDYLGNKTRVIQQATSGGRVFYRLRAMGFADLSDARRLCSALKAERADCIPVTVR
ncbi:SPOR domain-containing protein [uncultured Shimia sp.]|uniref:SPOR domain-containing protein n=1 Tax=uncultured Shimia sp. TaxID=573152 RepID=UPI002627AC26|nr:SPOR domain-containing protein [uncultured Shimia sp.]